jgi:hypothetical protein
MNRFILYALVLLTLGLAVGCAAAPIPAAAPTAAPAMPPEAYNPDTANEAAGGAPGLRQLRQSPASSADALQQDQQRMIVYTGSLSLQVNDTTETINKIDDLLKNVNGYIASKSLVAYGKDKLRGTITVRIPAAALDTTLAQIKALGVKVLKEDAKSSDVTEEYVDLDARRKNLEAYEVELQKLLETVRERTGKAEDILAVYNQLTEVRGQIEQIKGRQKYLENTSALATYTIELVPIEEIVVEGKPGWDPARTAGAALDHLVGALQVLGDIAINVILFVLPILLLLFLPVVVFVWIVRAIWKRRQPKKAPVTS